jgi:hypothetical protein
MAARQIEASTVEGNRLADSKESTIRGWGWVK